PLVAEPPPPHPAQLARGSIRCMEIRANAVLTTVVDTRGRFWTPGCPSWSSGLVSQTRGEIVEMDVGQPARSMARQEPVKLLLRSGASFGPVKTGCGLQPACMRWLFPATCPGRYAL